MPHRLFLLLLLSSLLAVAEPAEKRGRGLVALRISSAETLVSWRLLATDPPGVSFNVYRHTDPGEGTRLNAEPLTGATFLIDSQADLARDTHYAVRPSVDGVETGENPVGYIPAAAPARQYLSIPLEPPAPGVTPDGVPYTYSANDARWRATSTAMASTRSC